MIRRCTSTSLRVASRPRIDTRQAAPQLFVAGDLGLAFVVVAAVVAAAFWVKRGDLPNSIDAQRA
jgi:hypothetical protein